jgi:hypothetical protein
LVRKSEKELRESDDDWVNKLRVIVGKLCIPLILAGITLLLVFYSLMWIQLTSDRKLYSTTDFIAFYSAGRIAQSSDSAQVYNLDYQKGEEERILGYTIQPDEVNPFVHPPFVIPLLKLIINSDYLSSYFRWAFVLGALSFISGIFLVMSLQQKWGMSTILLLGVSVLFFPIMVSILNGQDSAVLLLGGSLWFYGLMVEKPWVAGLGLALTSIRPQISLVLAIPFLFKERKVFWWYLIGVLVLALFSLLTMGVDNIIGFLKILTVSAGGQGYLINEFGMVNLLGLMRNVFPGASPEILRYCSWGFYFFAVIFGSFLWMRNNFPLESKIAILVVLSLFFNPHLHFHDLVLLMVPIFSSIKIFLDKNKFGITSLTLIFIIIIFLLLANHLIQLPHIAAYLLMLSLVLLQCLKWKSQGQLILIDEK